MKRLGLPTIGVLLLLLAGVASSPAATRTWVTGSGTNDWFSPANWDGGSTVPGAGDDVQITIAGAAVLLTNSTPYLGSLTLSRTLVFSNWNTTLSATNVTIQSGGVMTLPAAFTNNMMSNNVGVICSNLTIDVGGSINVDGQGYDGGINAGGTWNKGNGPGYGTLFGNGHAGGAGHGGWSSKGAGAVGGLPYGSVTNPATPGSGGGSGYQGSVGDHRGGAGGGVVRIEAAGTVAVNGTISANGLPGGAVYVGGGGGAGGSIFIRCRTLEGTGGVVRAKGGNGGDGANGGCGGGGRMAILYDSAAEAALPSKPTVQFTALPGASGVAADLGSIYLADAYFLSETLTSNLAGQVWGMAGWEGTNLTVSNTWIRFPEEGMRLAASNDVKVVGANAKLELGGSITVVDRDMYYMNSDTGTPSLTIGQDLILTDGGALVVYAAMTNNLAATNYGALVSVSGDVGLASGSWIYPHSHPTNGGSVCFRMRNATVAAGAGFCADYRGFAGGTVNQDGYGSGKGLAAGGDYCSGAGYGGRGGRNQGSTGASTRPGGSACGAAPSPLDPGSGGGCGNDRHGGWGGGVVWIEATDDVVLNGALTANGEMPPYYTCGGGAGGGVYVTCRTIQGAAGLISAAGGNGATASCGGGGGGRMAINYNTSAQGVLPVPSLTFSCPGGSGYEYGDLGTLWLPDNRFLQETLTHHAQWVVPGFTNWLPSSLFLSNGWIRFSDAVSLTVTNGVQVVGTDPNLNKLEAAHLVCGGGIALTNGSLVIRATAFAPSLTCAGSIVASNGYLVFDGSATTGLTVNCAGNLILNAGSRLDVYAGATNGGGSACGASINVAGDVVVASNAAIYPSSHPLNGGSPFFRVRNLAVAKGAQINADARGFSPGIGYGESGYGPGKGIGYGGNYSGGAGYGGRGGQSVAGPSSGATYGSSNAPAAPGSGGGYGYGNVGYRLGWGGGLVWIQASDWIALDGVITANGQTPTIQTAGGGSGGGIYLACRGMAGNNGVLSASGGNGGNTGSDGGGGGGRIAVWRRHGDATQFVCSVSNGVGYTNAVVNYSEPGTVVWGWLPMPGTLFVVH